MKTEDKVNEKVDQYKDEAKDFVGNLKDQAYDAKDYLANKTSQIKDKAVDASDYVDGYVRDNPWKAVGIGVVAGLVISKLLDVLRK